jgi:succinate dehydrogenase / fumarate reductase cytochrome b subunit
MSWLKQTVSSSIGGKVIVALTGLGLVGFILGHLSGNLLVFAGPTAIDQYAEGLRHYPALLWAMRIGLIAMAVLHIGFTIKLNVANRAARPEAYALKKYRRASLQSRTMALSGLLLLAYLVYHLAHFTFRVTSPEIGALGAFEARKMLLMEFSNPVLVVTYVVAMVLLAMHLAHGIASLFHTLGLNHGKYTPVIRRLGPAVAFLVAAAYISIPVAIFFGFVQ